MSLQVWHWRAQAEVMMRSLKPRIDGRGSAAHVLMEPEETDAPGHQQQSPGAINEYRPAECERCRLAVVEHGGGRRARHVAFRACATPACGLLTTTAPGWRYTRVHLSFSLELSVFMAEADGQNRHLAGHCPVNYGRCSGRRHCRELTTFAERERDAVFDPGCHRSVMVLSEIIVSGVSGLVK